MIYLDNAATTRPCAAATEAALNALKENFFNPSALYRQATEVKNAIEESRSAIARQLACKSEEIFFTSGATESNNWAINSGFKNKRGNIVITKGEHPSVYEPAVFLRGKGVDVRIAPLTSDGKADETALVSLVDENTSLVSVIHASNETGALNDIFALAEKVKQKNPTVVFHSDGVQAFCKTPAVIGASKIDLYSISAHKIGGIKGVGALFVRKGLNLSPLLLGGGQERKYRSGTENVPSIIAFGKAVNSFDTEKASKMYDYAINSLKNIPNAVINSRSADSTKFIISVGIKGIKSEILQHMLSDKGVLIGLGSACSSKNRGNRVLEAMGVQRDYIEGNIRISFSPDNTLEEIGSAMKIIKSTVSEFRSRINE